MKIEFVKQDGELLIDDNLINININKDTVNVYESCQLIEKIQLSIKDLKKNGWNIKDNQVKNNNLTINDNKSITKKVVFLLLVIFLFVVGLTIINYS